MTEFIKACYPVMMLKSLQVREQVEVWVTAHPNIAGQLPGQGLADSVSVQL